MKIVITFPNGRRAIIDQDGNVFAEESDRTLVDLQIRLTPPLDYLPHPWEPAAAAIARITGGTYEIQGDAGEDKGMPEVY